MCALHTNVDNARRSTGCAWGTVRLATQSLQEHETQHGASQTTLQALSALAQTAAAVERALHTKGERDAVCEDALRDALEQAIRLLGNVAWANVSENPRVSTASVVTEEGDDDSGSVAPRYLVANFRFDPDTSNELLLHQGDVIEVVRTHTSGWWTGRLRGKVGFFPRNYCRVLSSTEEARYVKKVTARNAKRSGDTLAKRRSKERICVS